MTRAMRVRKRCLSTGLALALLHTPALPQDKEASTSELKQFSIEDLLAVQITSVSKKAERLNEAAASVQVITHDDIRRAGALTLPEALRLATGVQVARANGHEWGVSVRGFNSIYSNKLLVLIDGRSIYTPLFAGVFWDAQDIPLDDIKQIEVIRGPGATVWGANAVNGVINIITKKSGDTQGLAISAGGGSQMETVDWARYGGRLAPDIHYRVYGKFLKDGGLDLPDSLNGRDDRHTVEGGFRIDSTPEEGAHWTLQGNAFDGEGEQAGFFGGFDIRGGNLLGRWSRSYGQNSELSVQGYYDRSERRIGSFFDETRDTYDLELQYRLGRGRQDIVWGLGYRLTSDEVMDSENIRWRPLNRTLHLFSGFVQDDISLVPDKWHLVLGSKFEHNDFTGFEYQPSVRTSWVPNERHTLWAAFSRALRAPSRIDRDLIFLFAFGDDLLEVLVANPDFKTEELLSYEAGHRFQPRADLSLGLAGFLHVYDQLKTITPAESPTGFPSGYANSADGQTYGIEAEAVYQVSGRWRLNAGYAYLHKDIDSKGDDTLDDSNGNDAEHLFSLRSQMDLPRRLQLDAGLYLVDQLPAPKVPGYATLDLRLGWQATDQWAVELLGKNLLEGSHAEFGAAANRPQVPRSVFGRLLWKR